MFQVRVSLVKDVEKQEAMWERQHERAAEKIYAMCSDLGGFFLKVFETFLSFQTQFTRCFSHSILNHALKIPPLRWVSVVFRCWIDLLFYFGCYWHRGTIF